MAIGWQQLLIVLILVLVLFGGRGKISALMGDFAKGIKSFKKGLAEDDDDDHKPGTTHKTAALSDDSREGTAVHQDATDKTKA